VQLTPPSAPSRVGGVGVDVKGSGSVRISVRLASGQLIHRTIHALYTPDLSSRSAQRIGRLLSVSWMRTHSGCEFIFPSDNDTKCLHVSLWCLLVWCLLVVSSSLLVVPTRMGVLEPSGNGLFLLPHKTKLPSSPSTTTVNDPSVALIA
jgi:hypothetical protein